MNAMKYKGYTARMDFDAEDNILVGKILDIEDVIVFLPVHPRVPDRIPHRHR